MTKQLNSLSKDNLMRGTSWFHGNFGKFKILFFGTTENKLVGIAGFTAYGPAERDVKIKEYNQAAKAMEDNQIGMFPIVIVYHIFTYLYII